MRTFLSLICLIFLPCSCTSKVEPPEEAPVDEVGVDVTEISETADAAAAGPARIYIHVVSKGFEHQVAKLGEDGAPSLVEAKWAEWAAADERFEVVVSREAPDSLDDIDAVFFYTTGELPWNETQRAMLLDFVRGGGGVVGSHCATDTWYEWPEYGVLIGGYFAGHPWHEDVGVKVEVTDHPSTRHLGERFRITDEIYQHKDPWDRANLRVLMGLDPEATDMEKEGILRDDRDIAISWTRQEGEGRVFYSSLGHRADVWNDPRFQKHLVEGALWAMGR